ncbi:MAG TPA: hypothetical protein VKC61_20765 [Pyrinomonadaceae bacterium]|nr:hypothetical protein [Pyrinomonadaceae bacterium]
MDSTPILNGAPAFIVLGFTVALAAYLRQVSLHAQEIIDKIKSNAVGSFPYNEGKSIAKHTKEKLQLLENTRSKIAKVTRPVFVLMFFIAIRLVLYAVSKLKFSQSADFLHFLHWFDLAISLSIMILVGGLWYMHESARTKDHYIGEMAAAWKKSQINDQSEHSGTPNKSLQLTAR